MGLLHKDVWVIAFLLKIGESILFAPKASLPHNLRENLKSNRV